MLGITFLGNRELELREFADPTPSPRDVVLEIKASGMCGTDLHAYRREFKGTEHFIAGHEPCGVVVALGEHVTESEAKVGDRVMVHHYDGCGNCRHCKSGWSQLCDEGPTVYGSGQGHGAHARYMAAAAHTLVPLPEDLSFMTGAAISCGTGTAYGALKRVGLEGDETLAVYGQGPVGLSTTQFGAEMGAHVIAIETSPERRELALEKGAHAVIDPTDVDPVEAIKELTHGEGAHKVVETAGVSQARTAAVKGTRKWGTCCFIAGGGELTFMVGPDLVFRQVTLVGHWTFSKNGQADCARFVSDRKIDVDSVFTHQFKLEQADEAYKLLDQQKTGKGVFLPS
ncbi:MAG: iditol 2-dehydrogenase [Rhodospirillaceae bacterium]|nr:iditol 2-dehydrogenase [Rhodospirillaceae bacterium]|tara:strand:+ start:14021 stop:15046 length:1026 start_codon:yes stop_codon:yes gene_type:complete